MTDDLTKTRLRLLLVDDDEVDRRAVLRALGKTGLDTVAVECATAVEAERALSDGRYTCILLDYYLPDASGAELLRRIRATGSSVPVVVLTGRGDEEVAVEMMKAGATDYLAKASLSPERLAQALGYARRVHQAERLAREAEAALRTYTENLRELSRAALAIHSSLSTEEILEVTADAARRILGANVAVAALPPEGDGGAALESVACSERFAEQHDLEAAERGRRVALRVSETGRPLRLTARELRDHPRYRPAAPEPPLRGLVAVPLVCRKGERIGLVQVLDKGAGEFTEDDEAILLQLAQLASVGIENARLYEQAREAVRARDSVLAVVSHDLRNPLNAISTRLALIEETGSLGDTGAQSVEAIRRSIRQMGRLLEDLLDVARIEKSGLTVNLEPVEVGELLEEACELFQAQAEEGAVELDCTYAGSYRVRVDRWRILQVLSNLIANALRVTAAGGRVCVGVRERPGVLEMFVSDTGPGIPEEELPNLFQPFWQSKRRGSGKGSGGAGLGLAIARGIVEAHGGEIRVESREGEGTTFLFTLPHEAPDQTAA